MITAELLTDGDFLGNLVRDAHRELLPVGRPLRNLGIRCDRSEGRSMDEMLRRLTQFSHCAG